MMVIIQFRRLLLHHLLRVLHRIYPLHMSWLCQRSFALHLFLPWVLQKPFLLLRRLLLIWMLVYPQIPYSPLSRCALVDLKGCGEIAVCACYIVRTGARRIAANQVKYGKNIPIWIASRRRVAKFWQLFEMRLYAGRLVCMLCIVISPIRGRCEYSRIRTGKGDGGEREGKERGKESGTEVWKADTYQLVSTPRR